MIEQQRTAYSEDLLAQLENLAAFVRAQAPKSPGRQADVIERAHRMIDWVSRIRLGRVINFALNGDVQFDGTSGAPGLLEVFYTAPGPKTVRASVTAYDWGTYTHVYVEWKASGRTVSAAAVFRSDEARDLVAGCKEPSVHLLRRLQIAGVR
jgi:hypothetical protein